MKPKLTEDQIERARQMLAAGLTYKAIGQRLGCHGITVHCALDPEFARQRHESQKSRRETDKVTATVSTFSKETMALIADRTSFYADAAARLAEIPPDTRSLTAKIAGDPLPGRSAFDRRHGGQP